MGEWLGILGRRQMAGGVASMKATAACGILEAVNRRKEQLKRRGKWKDE